MKRFVVVVSDNEGAVSVHPLKDWLRRNPESIPPGMHPAKSTTHQLRNGLKKLGWTVVDTDMEVRLTKPSGASTSKVDVVRVKDQKESPSIKLNRQIVGNLGLYYVCYQLSKLGWYVMPTARNARGIDIVAYNRDYSSFIGVQVKAVSKRDPVPLDRNLEHVLGNFWIIVSNVATEPRSFVMLPAEVRHLAHRGEKDGRVSYWLQPASYDTQEFAEGWSRIGCG